MNKLSHYTAAAVLLTMLMLVLVLVLPTMCWWQALIATTLVGAAFAVTAYDTVRSAA